MNILYLCDEYPPGNNGGIGTYVQQMARAMAARGHKVWVAGFYHWAYGGEDAFTDGEVQVYRFRRQLPATLFTGSSFTDRLRRKWLQISGVLQRDILRGLTRYHAFLEQLIADHKIDLVEMPDYNDYIRFCNSIVLFPKLSVPVVVKLHGSLTYLAKETGQQVAAKTVAMERHLLQQATAVISVSNYAAQKTAAYLNYTQPITTLYNGIDINKQLPDVHRNSLQVAYAGTLTQKKGVYQLAKAWNIVHQQIPNAQLIIVGKGPQQPVKKLLYPDAAKNACFRGHLPLNDIYDLFAASAVAVFPSYVETFGLAPLEAMLYGAAVINTTRSAGPELITNNAEGLLADPDDVQGLAEKIIYLLQHTDERQRLAAAAQQKVKDKFALGIAVANHIVFYQQAVTAAHNL